MSKKKILVVVNKSWEFEPFYNALTSATLRPTGLKLPDVVNPVPTDTWMEAPRAVINNMENIQVVFRCVENMMDPEANKSDSLSKMKHMPTIIQGDGADFIISVSTAESTIESQGGESDYASINGSVICGSQFFMYDAREFNQDPTRPYLDVVEFERTNIPEDFFGMIRGYVATQSIPKLVIQKNSGTEKFLCDGDSKFASVGVVNISNYDLYADADRAAYLKFKELFPDINDEHHIPVCIETTHGIVNMCSNGAPTMFVSPITDRYERFSVDVTPIQNYIAGFNAGIVVSELLVALDIYYGAYDKK